MLFFKNFRKKTVPIGELGIVEDNHCHLLPGVDDGVQEMDETLAILGDMADFGIRTVRLTPHINPEIFPSDEESTLRNYYSLIGRLPQEIRDRLEVRLGAEYMVTPEFHQRDPKELLQFRDGKVLIEMSYYYPSLNIKEAVFNITSSGLKPVIAHPERYLYCAGNLKEYDVLHDLGCDFQLNLLSLGGAYGPDSVLIMKYLMKRGFYACVGTDTHTRAHFKKISHLELPSDLADGVKEILRRQEQTD